MHPDKTFLGCIKKGFDFLGVRFGDTPAISKTSLEKHRANIARRYAQGASAACIGRYIARWTSWCTSVLKSCNDASRMDGNQWMLAIRAVDAGTLLLENEHEKNTCF